MATIAQLAKKVSGGTNIDKTAKSTETVDQAIKNVAGSQGQMTGGMPPQAAKPSTAAKSGTAATPAGVAPAPFLTAAQQAAWENYQLTANSNLNTYNQELNDAPANEAKAEAAQNYSAAVSAANANALAAARGIMGSGINASNLADINTTLTNNIHTLQTNLGSLQTELNGKISDTQTAMTNTQQEYNDDAAANAQNAPTTTPAPAQPAAASATTPSPTAGTQSQGAVSKGVVNVAKSAPNPTITNMAKQHAAGMVPVGLTPKNPISQGGLIGPSKGW